MSSNKNSSVFCRQISTNRELNVNLGFCVFFKSIFFVIFSVLFRNNQSSNCKQFNRSYIVSIYNYVTSNFEQTLGYLAQIEQPSPGPGCLQTVISANPGLNLSLVSFFCCSKAYSCIISSNPFRPSNIKIVGKMN